MYIIITIIIKRKRKPTLRHRSDVVSHRVYRPRDLTQTRRVHARTRARSEIYRKRSMGKKSTGQSRRVRFFDRSKSDINRLDLVDPNENFSVFPSISESDGVTFVVTGDFGLSLSVVTVGARADDIAKVCMNNSAI